VLVSLVKNHRDATAYHSVHPNDSDRKSHRFFNGGIDQHQLVEGSFGPLVVMGCQDCITFIAELVGEIRNVRRVEEIEERVCHSLYQVSRSQYQQGPR
jgi:hypothetical protein